MVRVSVTYNELAWCCREVFCLLCVFFKTAGMWLTADTQEEFSSRSMLQGQFAQLVHSGEHSVPHEEAFSSLFNFPQDPAPKYLTCLILWSILQDGNSAPENELLPWKRWCTRRSFAPGVCPWSKTQEQKTLCVYQPLNVAVKIHFENTLSLFLLSGKATDRKEWLCQWVRVSALHQIVFGLSLPHLAISRTELRNSKMQ